MRRAARIDETQPGIVEALRYAGVEVYVSKQPCDLICSFRNQVFLIDCDGITKNRKRDKRQLEVFARLGVKLAKTPEAALHICGVIS